MPPSSQFSRPATDIMADRTGLKVVGIVFASMTIAVMMIAAVMVRAYADGGYSLDNSAGLSAPAPDARR